MLTLVVSPHIRTLLESESSSQTLSIIGAASMEDVLFTTYSVSNSFSLSSSHQGRMLTYTGVSPITAWVTSVINTAGYNTTFAQLSTGSITVALSSYPTGRLISYGSLYETAGEGAVASMSRVSDNNFLITGLLQ